MSAMETSPSSIPTPHRQPSYPVNVNVRLTIEQHAAVASIAEENDLSTSEATRWLLELGYADLKRRIGQALRDHAAEPDELAQGETPSRAEDARQLGDVAGHFISPPRREPEW